jgi:uncharacterized OB-fold protein
LKSVLLLAVTALPSIDYTLEYPYTRTTGPVMGPFLTGLRDGRILGIRNGDRVLCPPTEYDPETFATLEPDFVEVGPGGTVGAWTWVAHPTPRHPFDHPFAFALITLDGADTPMVHAVDAGDASTMSTGMRVRAQYRDERHGAITDVYFVPESEAVDQTIEPGDEPVEITEHLIAVRIQEELLPHRRRFAQGLLDGRIIGARSPATGKVYVPSRGYDPLARCKMTEADEIELPAVGTVVAFTQLTPVQYYGQTETEPWIRCSVLLDGADQPVTGIDVRDIDLDDFRVGMRLGCVWKPEGERDVSEIDNRFGAIPEGVYERWEPTGEPDVDPSTLTEHNW